MRRALIALAVAVLAATGAAAASSAAADGGKQGKASSWSAPRTSASSWS